MAKSSKFILGKSGNPATIFKAGNPHRWQSGQSGNPSGIVRSRLKFEELFYGALIGKGTPEDAAELLWQCARDREPWAIQALLQRLAPSTQQIKLTHEVEDGKGLDYTRIADAEIDEIERILERASTPIAAIEDGESQTHPKTVCHTGLARSGAGKPVR
jgi:hypothetical protein